MWDGDWLSHLILPNSSLTLNLSLIINIIINTVDISDIADWYIWHCHIADYNIINHWLRPLPLPRWIQACSNFTVMHYMLNIEKLLKYMDANCNSSYWSTVTLFWYICVAHKSQCHLQSWSTCPPDFSFSCYQTTTKLTYWSIHFSLDASNSTEPRTMLPLLLTLPTKRLYQIS